MSFNWKEPKVPRISYYYIISLFSYASLTSLIMIFSSQYFHFPSLLSLQSFLSKRTSSIYCLYSYPLLSPLQSGYYFLFLINSFFLDITLTLLKPRISIFLDLSLAFQTIANFSLTSLKLLVPGPSASLDVLFCVFISSFFQCLHSHKVSEQVLLSSYSIPFILRMSSTSMDCHSF